MAPGGSAECRVEAACYRCAGSGPGARTRLDAALGHGFECPRSSGRGGFFAPLARLSIVSQSRVIYCHEWLFEQGSLGDDAFKSAAVEHLGREIGLSAESAVGAKVGLIVLAGAAAGSTGLSQWVEARLGIPTRVADPFAAMKLNHCSRTRSLVLRCSCAIDCLWSGLARV